VTTATTAAVRDPFRPPAPLPVPVAAPAVEVMTITPELAREWLALNVLNRPVRNKHVSQLARDMKAGRWDLNGETIKRAVDGGVLDGQHRLRACVASQSSFRAFVISGLPPEAQQTIDIGAARRMSDHLSLDGEKNASVLASVARLGLIWLRGGRGRMSFEMDPTHAEMLAFVEAEPRLRDATDFAARVRKDLRPFRPAVWGVSWLLFTGVNDVAAQVFLERVRDGADIGIGHPAHTLRARIFRSKDERLTEWEQLALIITAWNHFRDETPITKLLFPKGGLTPKNFPEPK
jgi:hypothetical protein